MNNVQDIATMAGQKVYPLGKWGRETVTFWCSDEDGGSHREQLPRYWMTPEGPADLLEYIEPYGDSDDGPGFLGEGELRADLSREARAYFALLHARIQAYHQHVARQTYKLTQTLYQTLPSLRATDQDEHLGSYWVASLGLTLNGSLR